MFKKHHSIQLLQLRNSSTNTDNKEKKTSRDTRRKVELVLCQGVRIKASFESRLLLSNPGFTLLLVTRVNLTTHPFGRNENVFCYQV